VEEADPDAFGRPARSFSISKVLLIPRGNIRTLSEFVSCQSLEALPFPRNRRLVAEKRRHDQEMG